MDPRSSSRRRWATPASTTCASPGRAPSSCWGTAPAAAPTPTICWGSPATFPPTRVSVVLVDQPWVVAGRRIATAPPTLDLAWTAVLSVLRPLVGATARLPLVVGGRSAGARVACRTAGAVGAAGVLLLAFPLVPPDARNDVDKHARALEARRPELTAPSRLGLPTVVAQGARDPFGTAAEMRDVLRRTRGARGGGDPRRRPLAAHAPRGPRSRARAAAGPRRCGRWRSHAGNDPRSARVHTSVRRRSEEGERVLVRSDHPSGPARAGGWRLRATTLDGDDSEPDTDPTTPRSNALGAARRRPGRRDRRRARARFERDALPFLDQLYAAALRMTAQPRRRRGPRAGDLRQGVRRVPPVPHGTNLKAWLYRILTNTYINSYRKKQREPSRARRRLEDWQLGRAESHTSSGLRSAEAEAIDHVPDADVKDALQATSRGFPAGGLPRRRRGLRLQGDRRHHEDPDRHRHVRLHRGRRSFANCSRTTRASAAWSPRSRRVVK